MFSSLSLHCLRDGECVRKRQWRETRVDMLQLSFGNVHSVGTAGNNPMSMTGVRRVRSRHRQQPIVQTLCSRLPLRAREAAACVQLFLSLSPSHMDAASRTHDDDDDEGAGDSPGFLQLPSLLLPTTTPAPAATTGSRMW